MSLNEATIQELRQILKEDYGQEVNDKEAFEIATNLVGYFDLLAKIYHRIRTQNDDDENTND